MPLSRARMLYRLLILAMLGPAALAQAELTGQISLHDPSRIVKDGERYYVFSTGRNISVKRSDDLVHWTDDARVFADRPEWTRQAVPGFNGRFWAPDVVCVHGQYRLYYSVSTFGSQVSAIGLATNSTLDPTSPEYQWIDRGAVIQSEAGSPYNAIDPALFLDDAGKHWLTFGSYWNGVAIIELDPASGKRVTPTSAAIQLAQNPPSTEIEAPYLHKHGGLYYLFVNWGKCCRGVRSTYNIRVGRSNSPTGPFVDKSGLDMRKGGGTLFLAAEGPYIGPGHLSIFSEDGREYFSYHYYDGGDRGRSKFNIRPLAWTSDGWPAANDAK